MKYERLMGREVVTGHGTVFACARHRFLTAAHNVLDEDKKPYASLFVEDGKDWIHAEVLCSNVLLDIALVEANIDIQPLEVSRELVKEGDKVLMIGSCRGDPISQHVGIVEEKFFEGSVRHKINVLFDHGFSGCPMLAGGKVVGLAVAGIRKGADLDPEYGLFLPVEAVLTFLERKH
jgi:hypothetical protein